MLTRMLTDTGHWSRCEVSILIETRGSTTIQLWDGSSKPVKWCKAGLDWVTPREEPARTSVCREKNPRTGIYYKFRLTLEVVPAITPVDQYAYFSWIWYSIPTLEWEGRASYVPLPISNWRFRLLQGLMHTPNRKVLGFHAHAYHSNILGWISLTQGLKYTNKAKESVCCGKAVHEFENGGCGYNYPMLYRFNGRDSVLGF